MANQHRVVFDEEIQAWLKVQQDNGIELEPIKNRLKNLAIEVPSWGFLDSGTRFKVFQQVGVPRNPYEKLDDAAQVHRLTGASPKVAIHIPWDKVDDYVDFKNYANQIGLKIGAVNPNLFQDDEFALGTVCHPQEHVRKKAIDHILECVEIMKQVDSDVLSLWFADGTNYPGQDNMRKRKRYMYEALSQTYAALPDNARMLIEYKFFEPAFYHTDLSDWGTSYNYSLKLGDKAQVLVDLGHHAQGTNIAHIIAILLDEGKLGGFHFNNRKYADDDLMVGTIDPYELFLICNELVDGERDPATSRCANNIAYMIDQSHNVEQKIPATIKSVMNVQTAFAKALLVQRDLLQQAQEEGNVIAAESVLKDAFETDVRPLLALVREEMGLPRDPLASYAQSEYAKRIQERGIGGQRW